MRTARAKGENWVVLKHGPRNANDPGSDHGITVWLRQVFHRGRKFSTNPDWTLTVDSVEMRDYPVIQAEILLFSLGFNHQLSGCALRRH